MTMSGEQPDVREHLLALVTGGAFNKTGTGKGGKGKGEPARAKATVAKAKAQT